MSLSLEHRPGRFQGLESTRGRYSSVKYYSTQFGRNLPGLNLMTLGLHLLVVSRGMKCVKYEIGSCLSALNKRVAGDDCFECYIWRILPRKAPCSQLAQGRGAFVGFYVAG